MIFRLMDDNNISASCSGLICYCSVSGCACHDIRRFRIPDDVPQAIRIQFSGFQPVSGGLSRAVGYSV